MHDLILKQFNEPDEVRRFEKGKFEIIRIGGMTLGRSVYEPGWKWSLSVGASLAAKSCQIEHVGMVLSGRIAAIMEDGRVVEMKPGDVFYIAPGHDACVVGNEPCVSLHLLGTDQYAKSMTASQRARDSTLPDVHQRSERTAPEDGNFCT